MNIEEINEKLLQLNNSWYYGEWPKQLVINLFEKIDEINIEQETPFHISEQFGALSGEITYLLEVYNPALETDIKILQSLLQITNEYQNYYKTESK